MPPKDRKRGKGGKFRKKKKELSTISTEDIDYLVAKTNYDAVEIVEWFTGFIEDNPDGTLTKGKMMEMYEAVLPGKKAKVFVDQIFVKFDRDLSGTIDFKASVKRVSLCLHNLRISLRSLCSPPTCPKLGLLRKS